MKILSLALGLLALAPSPSASAVETSPYRYSLGIGYPDLRVRAQVWGPLDAELKFAFGDGIQAYSTRAYVRAYEVKSLRVFGGAEAGMLSFSGVEGLNGSGRFFQGFAGLEYGFTQRLGLSADIGPAYVSLGDGKDGVGGLEWIFTTAFYFRVF